MTDFGGHPTRCMDIERKHEMRRDSTLGNMVQQISAFCLIMPEEEMCPVVNFYNWRSLFIRDFACDRLHKFPDSQ